MILNKKKSFKITRDNLKDLDQLDLGDLSWSDNLIILFIENFIKII